MKVKASTLVRWINKHRGTHIKNCYLFTGESIIALIRSPKASINFRGSITLHSGDTFNSLHLTEIIRVSFSKDSLVIKMPNKLRLVMDYADKGPTYIFKG